ncbi:MarR family transcriptional regulator [Actinokineospora xionganensis]|uniref:MarR family transcriptional regulator n=1 Tax=Actinokineospora xionganensis TaxID=2684470 RepID=A0ABR7LE67_9PSEU|nr:MarR family transcriptional regulator [Actinokineospora xionganensis]MBC6451000.1 MarR family transcriptional regulator [Actinokineospora xionganensis]
MSSVSSSDADDRRRKRRLTNDIKESLRELSVQLSLLNHQVSGKLDLRDADLECLDLITRHGPLTPSALAKRAGMHPATMTGVLDRLERGGWISRDRDPSDRRAVLIQARKDRAADVFALYSGMNSSMDDIVSGYSEAELQILADFLTRTTNAGQEATKELFGG